MEALWTYFLPHYQFVLELIQNKTYGNVLNLYADFGFFRPFNNDSRVFKKSLGGGSLLDIGIYPIFSALSILGKPNIIKADATFYENGADSSCDIIFQYSNDVSATLKSSLLKDLNTEAIIECEKATIKLNRMFHKPTTVSIISDGKEDIKDFGYQTLGYNYEIIHFNQLIRDGKTESDVMTFEFSKLLIKTLDDVRETIGLNY
jgi:predicted dehydrogenase